MPFSFNISYSDKLYSDKQKLRIPNYKVKTARSIIISSKTKSKDIRQHYDHLKKITIDVSFFYEISLEFLLHKLQEFQFKIIIIQSLPFQEQIRKKFLNTILSVLQASKSVQLIQFYLNLRTQLPKKLQRISTPINIYQNLHFDRELEKAVGVLKSIKNVKCLNHFDFSLPPKKLFNDEFLSLFSPVMGISPKSWKFSLQGNQNFDGDYIFQKFEQFIRDMKQKDALQQITFHLSGNYDSFSLNQKKLGSALLRVKNTLQVLNVSFQDCRFFADKDCPLLHIPFAELQQLNVLKLEGSLENLKNIKYFSEFVSSLTNCTAPLKEFSMKISTSTCKLEDDLAKELNLNFKRFFSCQQKLEKFELQLKLQQIYQQNDPFEIIIENLGQLQNLKELTLNCSKSHTFVASHMKAIENYIQKNENAKNLISLKLIFKGANVVPIEDFQAFLDRVNEVENLEILQFDLQQFPNFNKKYIEMLYKFVTSFKKLKFLELHGEIDKFEKETKKRFTEIKSSKEQILVKEVKFSHLFGVFKCRF